MISARRSRSAAEGRQSAFTYDINFVVDQSKAATPPPAGASASTKNGVSLEVASTEPGVQFYDGAWMNVPVPGLGGRPTGVRRMLLRAAVFPGRAQPSEFSRARFCGRARPTARRPCSVSRAVDHVGNTGCHR